MTTKNRKSAFVSFFEDFGLLLLSVALFLGGAFILAQKIAFWSLFLGIASVQVGIVLIILTYDAFSKRKSKVVTEDYKTLACLVCKRSTFVPKYSRTAICDSCQVKIAITFKGAMVIIFALAGLTTGMVLVNQRQQFAQRAQVGVDYVCETGEWNPRTCKCGKWRSEPEGDYRMRECFNEKYYFCRETEPARWFCGST